MYLNQHLGSSNHNGRRNKCKSESACVARCALRNRPTKKTFQMHNLIRLFWLLITGCSSFPLVHGPKRHPVRLRKFNSAAFSDLDQASSGIEARRILDELRTAGSTSLWASAQLGEVNNVSVAEIKNLASEFVVDQAGGVFLLFLQNFSMKYVLRTSYFY